MIITPKWIMQKIGLSKEDREEDTVEELSTKKKAPDITVESSSENLNFSATDKEKEILNMVSELGGSCKHSQISSIIKQRNLSYYKQDGTWKESWMILQKLVKKGTIAKEDKIYRRL